MKLDLTRSGREKFDRPFDAGNANVGALAERHVLLAEKLDHPSDQASGDNDRERIHRILQRVIARRASQDEQAILERGLERARKQFAQEPDAAVAFLSVGQSARDETIDASELAAWTSLCLAVLNFDETLNRE